MRYQNNYVSSYLFLKNLPVLLEKAIKISSLLDSKVFNHVFDFDAWPGNHPSETECIRPYNGSFFQVRHAYSLVFPEPEYAVMEEEKEDEEDEQKV